MSGAKASLAPERMHLGSLTVEVLQAPDGQCHVRCPDILPVNARHWRGPYRDRQAALGDLAARTALPRLTRAEVVAKQRHGYLGPVGGVPHILHLCRLTGATVLTPFVLVDEVAP